MKRALVPLSFGLIVLGALTFLRRVSATDPLTRFDVDWHTVAAGGVAFSTGGDFELSGTIGEPGSGTLSGGEFELSRGFWFGRAAGDCVFDAEV